MIPYYQNNSVFRRQVVYVKQRRLLVKHIIDHPAPPVSGRIMSSLANRGGLAGLGGIAGIGGGLAG